MLESLCTQTRLHNLTIQDLNMSHFIDIWYTSLTSVHYNLDHRLAIVTEAFVKVQLRSDVTSHTIPDTI